MCEHVRVEFAHLLVTPTQQRAEKITQPVLGVYGLLPYWKALLERDRDRIAVVYPAC